MTKSQLYQGKNVPHSDKFTVGSQSNCPFHLTKRVVTNNGKTWTEKQRTLKLDFFNKNQVEECGATIFQDEYGIIYETFIRGRTSQQQPAPYTPQERFIKYQSSKIERKIFKNIDFYNIKQLM